MDYQQQQQQQQQYQQHAAQSPPVQQSPYTPPPQFQQQPQQSFPAQGYPEQQQQQPVQQQHMYPTPQDQILHHPSTQYSMQQPAQYQSQRDMQPQYAQGANVHSQEWQSNLCDCSPCENCLLGTFLPCLLLGRTAERMRDPTMQNYESINTDCMLMCGISYFTGCGWIYAMMKRSEIRERFGIDGSGFGDCCTTYWCPCCALIQQEKEVVARTSQGPIAQGYVSQPSMQMPPPQAQPQSPPPKN
ncbi:uncharacterized protein E0L32_004606 [Thyridium curvatum]|uniref:Uncharacterized protein n=1 Tax=Thyridium curvatum TaxID=1093900 RepID=A0A507BD47_9PEZI|nr:uncharacterized protein E0L32_004606 [Thyridium curvatum]TPX15329.1 hypothetical protein E0L32_004606 [Thyridium curvatum]